MNLADLEELVIVDKSEQPTIETLLVLGSPAVVDTEDLSEYKKLHELAETYKTNSLIKAAKG